MPDTGVAYQFTVIAEDVGGSTHEPAWLPGGYVFIPAGLILAAQNEAEFVGMLSHAMAHETERRAVLSNGAFTQSVFIGDSPVPLPLLESQRKLETEADVLAGRAGASAGYDPEALVRYVLCVQRDTRTSRLPPVNRRAAA